MAAGAWAKLLNGTCVNIPTRNNIPAFAMPFREFTIHTVFGEPPGNFNVNSATCGCGFRTDAQGNGVGSIGTARIDPFSLPNGSTAYGETYGRRVTANPITMKTIGGADLYFATNDLYRWQPRAMYVPNYYQNFASGPSIQWGHLATPVRRRMKGVSGPNNSNYQNRYSFDFTDAGSPINNQPDYLGQLHPAHCFWTNKGLIEPFLAETYYEQTGQSPNAEITKLWTVPFCDPLRARNSSGTVLGTFIGYTMIHYFSFAFVHYGDATVAVTNQDGSTTTTSPFLPENYRGLPDGTGKKPKINNSYQLWTVDTHIFMVNDTPSVGSPKIASVRHWFYNDPTAEPDPINEYFYTIHGALQSQWTFPVEFNIVGGQPQTIQFSFSSMRVYLTP